MTRPAQYLRPYLLLHPRSAFKPASSAYLRYYNIVTSRDADPDILKPPWRHQLLKGETECPKSVPKGLYPRHATHRLAVSRRFLEELSGPLGPDTINESKDVVFDGKSKMSCR